LELPNILTNYSLSNKQSTEAYYITSTYSKLRAGTTENPIDLEIQNRCPRQRRKSLRLKKLNK
jgi:hypothetical protein